MSDLTYGNYGAATRDRTHTQFAQTMGYVAITTGFFALGAYLGRNLSSGWAFVWYIVAFVCLIAMNFTVKRSAGLTVVLLFAVGLGLGLALAPTLAYYASMNPQVLWQAGGATALFIAGFGAAGYATRHDHAREFADKYADRGVSIHQGNVGHNEDVLRVFGEVLGRHGHVDILVNNAGITIDKTVRKMTPEEWDHVIHVNLSGAFYLSRALLQHMLDRGYGRIVNISSVIGSAGGFGQANYAAAKSGMFGLTMSLALETASKGITVNTVTPGYITTDMTAAVPPEVMEKIVARIPVGRLGEPGEVARVVEFLADPESGYITGQVYPVNGGLYM